jgi:hypothetical protein
MKEAYFVHQDRNAASRQSDGVEFCIIPEFYDNKIYFYCHEYDTFWKSIADAGDLDKSSDFRLKEHMRPASLEEICIEGLCSYINTVKQYIIEGGRLVETKYIHL